MSVKLKPYSEYKNPGVPWLRQVPEDWKILRAKWVFRCIDVRSAAGAEELLTVSAKDGVVPRSQKKVTMFMAESYEGYKLCWPGDLVINSLWAWAKGLGFSRYHGIVSSAYGVYRPKTAFVDLWPYFDNLLRSEAYDWELHFRSKGIWVSRLQLTDESFLDMPILLPPVEEAKEISRFLASACSRINSYIRTKQQLIKLLEEQKQAIIHRAITRGLEPRVRLKPSKVDWLGNIPEHWTTKRFKFVTRITSGQIDPREEAYRDLILIAPNHIESGSGRILLEQSANDQGADSGKYIVKKGQVIYSKIRPNLRKATIAPRDCLCSADMYPISPKEGELRARYLLHLLLSAPFTKSVVDYSMRVAMPKVNREVLGACWLWYPSLAEQDAILSKLGESIAPSEALIARAHREIALLREYRTRLIADVVTGNLDVRGTELHAMAEAEVVEDSAEAEETETDEDSELVTETTHADN